MEFIDLKAQLEVIRPQVMKSIEDVITQGNFILGKEVKELETQIASYLGVKHAIGCANWTDGLTICLMALGVGPGDDVITPPFSFFATTEAICLLGARPVFVDIDARTYNMDPKLLEAAITKSTKAILPVSLYGQCADFDAINAIAKKYGIPVLEDAAQSFGATYKGKKSGALSLVSGTSFFPSKPLGCYGDGGMCFTDSDEIATALRQIRAHGQAKRYEHVRLGVNSRLDTLQAAILIEKMKIFDHEFSLRQAVAAQYAELLDGVVESPYIDPAGESVFAQYTVEVDNRDEVQRLMQLDGVPTCVHYPKPLHMQPALKFLNVKEGSFLVSERASGRVLSLPFHPYLKNEDQKKVVGALGRAIEMSRPEIKMSVKAS